MYAGKEQGGIARILTNCALWKTCAQSIISFLCHQYLYRFPRGGLPGGRNGKTDASTTRTVKTRIVSTGRSFLEQKMKQAKQILTVFRSVDSSLRVHDGHWVVLLSHTACRRGMIHGLKRSLDPLEDLLVRGHAGARIVLRSDCQVLLQDGSLVDLPQSFEGSDGDLNVGLIGQPVWVDQRIVVHAG